MDTLYKHQQWHTVMKDAHLYVSHVHKPAECTQNTKNSPCLLSLHPNTDTDTRTRHTDDANAAPTAFSSGQMLIPEAGIFMHAFDFYLAFHNGTICKRSHSSGQWCGWKYVFHNIKVINQLFLLLSAATLCFFPLVRKQHKTYRPKMHTKCNKCHSFLKLE